MRWVMCWLISSITSGRTIWLPPRLSFMTLAWLSRETHIWLVLRHRRCQVNIKCIKLIYFTKGSVAGWTSYFPVVNCILWWCQLMELLRAYILFDKSLCTQSPLPLLRAEWSVKWRTWSLILLCCSLEVGRWLWSSFANLLGHCLTGLLRSQIWQFSINVKRLLAWFNFSLVWSRMADCISLGSLWCLLLWRFSFAFFF